MDLLEPFKNNPLGEGENGLALCGEIYKLGAGAERVNLRTILLRPLKVLSEGLDGTHQQLAHHA